MDTSAPGSIAIPLNLDHSVSLKHGDLGFVYKVNRRSSSHSSSHDRILHDAAGNSLISLSRDNTGCWKGFKGEELIFRVQRTKNTLTTTELEVFLAGKNLGDNTSDFKVKGCPFMRSCTIYSGNDIVAQTNLMNKLKQVFVKRNKFRLTIFPGSVDHALIAALVAIFLKG